MKITGEHSDAAVLRELGGRIARHRLDRGLSQDVLAREAGLSLNPVRRMERGQSVQTASLLRVLRVLRLLDNLDVVVPESEISPMRLLRQQGDKRQRAPRQSSQSEKPWQWGEKK